MNNKFKNILAFDTALQGCSVGVCVGGKSSTRTEKMASGQGEQLLPIINDVMAQAGLKFSSLDAIVTTLGPGAFTGLRIGLSAAKSMGLAVDKPVFGITTLQALALQYVHEKKIQEKELTHPLAVILETKRDDFYFQSFTKDAKAEGEARAIGRDALKKILEKGDCVMIGDGVERFARPVEVEGACLLVDAGFVAKYFYENNSSDVFSTDVAPLYLRGADVSAPKKPQRPLITSS
jgi:tRNA threonylcarbamoyladenosine biosynthesis protein TsaB